MPEEINNDEIGDVTSDTPSVHDGDIDGENLYQSELFATEDYGRIEENSKSSPMREAFKAIQPGKILGVGNVHFGEFSPEDTSSYPVVGEETRSLELGLVV